MRDLELDESAALMYCPFRSLLHLPTWADRRRVFGGVAASRRPGGRFAWNAVADNRVDITLDSGDSISLWWGPKNEWLGLIDVAGLELEALYGDFDRTPFDDESREYVIVARKPSESHSR